MKTNKQLRELIHTVLDCPTHFIPPTITENDPVFTLGKKSIVICEECVTKLRAAIGFELNEPVGSPYAFRERERLRREK